MSNVRISQLPVNLPIPSSILPVEVMTSPGVYTTSQTQLSTLIHSAAPDFVHFESTLCSVTALSAGWQTAFVNLCAYAPSWIGNNTLTSANSSRWSSAYNTVTAYFPYWQAGYTFSTGNGASVVSTVSANSGSWGGGQSVYTTVNTNSAAWQTAGSGGGVSVYNTVNPLSAAWTSVSQNVTSLSGHWEGAFTNLYPNSGNWNSAYTLLNTTTATTFLVNNLSAANSATVKNLSATGSVTVNNLSATGGVTVAGNVGIGTNTPNVSLTVVGTISATNIVNGSPFMYRNRIINGDMRIDQRANGGVFTLTNQQAVYGSSDRWLLFTNGSNLSARRVSGSTLGAQYAIALSGATGNTQSQLIQRIEATNCYDLAGQQVTVSFKAYANQNISSYCSLIYATATDNYTNYTTDNQSYNLTTTPANYSFTFTVPTTATNGIAVYAFNGALTSGQAVYITNVQLELGLVATPFEIRPIGSELALCQRYAVVFTGQNRGNNSNICAVQDNGNSQVSGLISYPVIMRTSPTLLYSAFGDISWIKTSNSSIQTATGLSLFSSCPNAGVILANGSSIGGNVQAILYVSGTNGYITLNAEL